MGLKKISPIWGKYGSDVRKWRKAAKLTLKDLAPLVGLSEASLSYVENGKMSPKDDHAAKIDAALGAKGKLLQSWERCSNHGLVPVGFRKVVDIEKEALELRFYQPVLVPGLVQAPEYAKALFAADRPQADEETIERLVQGRLQRQKIFNRLERPIVCVVVEESVLRRLVGGVPAMRAQLAHLVDVIGKRWVRFQVLPRTPREHPGFPGGFRIMVLEDQTVVSAEHAFDEVLIEDPDQIRKAVSVYGRLQGEALSPHDSLELVRQLEQGEL